MLQCTQIETRVVSMKLQIYIKRCLKFQFAITILHFFPDFVTIAKCASVHQLAIIAYFVIASVLQTDGEIAF